MELAGTYKLFKELELPLVEVLTQMECEGINLDTSFLKTLSKELLKDIEALEKKIYLTAGENFNIDLHARSLANVKSNMGRLGDIVTATRDLTATPVGVPVPTIQLARRFFIHLVSAPTVFQGMDTFANTFLVHSARRRRS